MTEDTQPNALHLDLDDLRAYLTTVDLETMFVTVSGAHIYGFPSADSDVDLRGCHRLPLNKIVGLAIPNQTCDRADVRAGIEVDIVSHEIGKYFNLLVKNNGYILEQVFSPIVVKGQAFLDELRPLAKNCITKNHYYHYRGFFQSQLKLLAKQEPVTAKAMLYAYRVLATGIHLMNTGEVVTDLNQLAYELKIADIPELIASKVEEKVKFNFDVEQHLSRLEDLETTMEAAFEASKLPESPDRDAVNELLVELRLGRTGD